VWEMMHSSQPCIGLYHAPNHTMASPLQSTTTFGVQDGNIEITCSGIGLRLGLKSAQPNEARKLPCQSKVSGFGFRDLGSGFRV